MGAPDEWLYEYAVVRFVPRPEREEFLNIGLVMMCKRRKWMRGLVVIDEEKLQALYPGADLDGLKYQSRLFEREDVPGGDLPVEEKYRWLTAVKSASLQVSQSHPAIVGPELTSTERPAMEILTEEFDRLFSILVL